MRYSFLVFENGSSYLCQMPMELTILGTSSATPTTTRHPSAQVLCIKNRLFMIDCGEGTQLQCMVHGVKFQRIERVFISHLHQDHYLGLLGIITTMNLNGRQEPFYIYGPKGLDEIMEVQFKWSSIVLNYALEFFELKDDGFQIIYDDEYLEVQSFPVKHRVPCWGFTFKEKSPFRNMKKGVAESKNIPIEAFKFLKSGEDYTSPDGVVFSFEELTELPKLSSYAYITDTIYLPELAPKLRGFDTIYHEATYLHDMLPKAEETFHSTAKQAAEFAAIAGCDTLILGHFSARYHEMGDHLLEATAVFKNTLIAEEGKSYAI